MPRSERKLVSGNKERETAGCSRHDARETQRDEEEGPSEGRKVHTEARGERRDK